MKTIMFYEVEFCASKLYDLFSGNSIPFGSTMKDYQDEYRRKAIELLKYIDQKSTEFKRRQRD